MAGLPTPLVPPRPLDLGLGTIRRCSTSAVTPTACGCPGPAGRSDAQVRFARVLASIASVRKDSKRATSSAGRARPGQWPPGDHARDEHEQVGRLPGADERCREAAERLGDDDQVAPVADRLDDRGGIVGPASRLVLAGQVGRDDVMPEVPQLLEDEVPVPADVAGAVDQDVRSHGTSVRPLSTHHHGHDGVTEWRRRPGMEHRRHRSCPAR